VSQAGGIAVLLSPKKEGRVFGLASGGSLAEFKPNSFHNHTLAVSANGRFICVASFTADVMVRGAIVQGAMCSNSMLLSGMRGSAGVVRAAVIRTQPVVLAAAFCVPMLCMRCCFCF
jgi:hypothetical protein